jgi:hypothetical protein
VLEVFLSPKPSKLLPFNPVKDISLDSATISSKIDEKSTPYRPNEFSAEELAICVSRFCCYGIIRESFHSKSERAERQISADDILYGLRRSWKLAAKPNFDSRCGNWEYLIETCDTDEQVLHVKIAVDDDAQRITIITKY